MNSKLILTYLIVLFLSDGSGYKRNIETINNDLRDPNSDINLNSHQMILKYNYIAEKHVVITEDGYQIKVFRLKQNGPPVLLVHGIGDSSDSWLVLGPENSLAYMLADEGFDVWLYNARGNKYSKGHIENLPDEVYWNFSYEEMGSKDLPATIDYILRYTSHDKLSYIGFSQGTTVFFIMCSMRPEYNKKIKQSILLAPVVYTSHVKHPLMNVLVKNFDLLSKFLDEIKLYELFPSNRLLSFYHASVCRNGSVGKVFCDIEYYTSYGLRDMNNILVEKLPVIASHIPAGMSSKTLLHFIQGCGSKKFQSYDYSYQKNKLVYGLPQPLEYNLASVSAPIKFIVSEADWFGNIEDFRTLVKKLPKNVSYVVLNRTMDVTHIEFIYGSRAKSINDKIVSFLLNSYRNFSEYFSL